MEIPDDACHALMNGLEDANSKTDQAEREAGWLCALATFVDALIEAARAEWSAPPAVNKHWTSEQAWDVQKAFEAANPGAERGPLGVGRGPYFAWYALQRLDAVEEGYNTGTKPDLLLYAMCLCIKNDIPLSDWVKKAFLEAYEKGCNGKLRSMSWNEVFGRPPRTKQQCDRLNRDHAALPEIWRLVAEAKRDRVPIDNELFKKIGGPFGLSSTGVKELYTVARSIWGKR
jgi:hypothetical protein